MNARMLSYRDLLDEQMDVACISIIIKVNRRIAENVFALPLGSFADISYLVEN